MTAATTPRMPAVFIGHGSPMNTLQANRYTETWRRIGQAVPRPRAVLAISAHWYIRGLAVTAMPAPETIHDFRGFPPELTNFEYSAPGSPALAARVKELLGEFDLRLDDEWGLDHGTWSVLAHLFPAADVPVVQLSIDATQPATFHYDLGRRLAPLREEGVLIVGSGNVVHNLRVLKRSEERSPYDWAQRFNEHVRAHLLERDHPSLIHYEMLGESARQSVPTPEHYLPLLYVIALQRDDEPVSVPVDGIESGSIGMLTAVVGQVGV
jgi:4,5-DOPA dioxygenase extradiol